MNKTLYQCKTSENHKNGSFFILKQGINMTVNYTEGLKNFIQKSIGNMPAK